MFTLISNTRLIQIFNFILQIGNGISFKDALEATHIERSTSLWKAYFISSFPLHVQNICTFSAIFGNKTFNKWETRRLLAAPTTLMLVS